MYNFHSSIVRPKKGTGHYKVPFLSLQSLDIYLEKSHHKMLFCHHLNSKVFAMPWFNYEWEGMWGYLPRGCLLSCGRHREGIVCKSCSLWTLLREKAYSASRLVSIYHLSLWCDRRCSAQLNYFLYFVLIVLKPPPPSPSA